MKKSVLVGLFASLLLSVSAQAADKLKMGVVVKIGGIPWFNAMEAGIKSESAKRGIDAWMVGPTAAVMEQMGRKDAARERVVAEFARVAPEVSVPVLVRHEDAPPSAARHLGAARALRLRRLRGVAYRRFVRHRTPAPASWSAAR